MLYIEGSRTEKYRLSHPWNRSHLGCLQEEELFSFAGDSLDLIVILVLSAKNIGRFDSF
jgi:hypothetical protein